MDKYTVKEITDKKQWEDFVLFQNPQSFLQSWNWGETNRLTGNSVIRVGIFSGNKVVGGAQIIEERAKRGPYFLIPGGPLIDWDNKQLVKFFIQTIRKLAKEKKVWFIRVRPELIDSHDHRRIFNNLGFINAPMHLSAENTWVLDITQDEEQLLASMRKTTRYLIRQSLKTNLEVEIENNPKHVKILTKLQEETVRRHKFVGFSQNIFLAQLETFGADNQAALFICKKGRTPLAAAIIIFYNFTAYYHHSGSTSAFKGLPFSYFLQWKIIQEAKKRKCKLYNFWGVAPNDNPKHRFAGVTIFKKGFGGEQVDWLHAQDMPISFLYWATYLFETARRYARGLVIR